MAGRNRSAVNAAAFDGLSPQDAESWVTHSISGWSTSPCAEFDAYWMLKAAEGGICIVLPQALSENDRAAPTFLVLLTDGGGRWGGGQKLRADLLAKGRALARGAVYAKFEEWRQSDEKAAFAYLRRMLNYLESDAKGRIDAASFVMPTVQAVMMRYGDADAAAAVVCLANEVDANRNALGFDDCVYDLQAGCAMGTADAKESLVTQSVGMRLEDLPDPDAPRHQDVDAIFYRPDVADELMGYLRQAAAWSLKGRPDQAYNLLVDAAGGADGREGKGNAGKTTLLQALQYSLGDYGGVLDLAAMQVSRPGSPSAELEPLALRRMVWSDEAAGQQVNADRFKRLTGSGLLKYRLLYQNFQERPVLATIFGAANAPLKLELTDDAEKRRYRPIPIPEIPAASRRKELKDAFALDTDGSGPRRADLLAMLLDELSDMTGPPEPPQAVRDLADAHQAANDGTMGEWARGEVIPGGSDAERLLCKDAWRAFCAMVPERERWTEQAKLTRMISRVHGVGAKLTRAQGRQGNGWVGLRLSDAAEQALVADGRGRQKEL